MFDPNFPFAILGGIVCRYNQRLDKWEILKGTESDIGYFVVGWKTEKGRKFDKVHRIVWKLYNGNIPEGFEINHIDMDKSNNEISNLELVNHKQNILLAREIKGNWSPSKLKHWQIELLLAIPEGWRVLHSLADRWNVSKFTLGNIRAKAKRENDKRYLSGL